MATFKDGTFGAFASAHGVHKLSEFTHATFAKRLHAEPKKVAVNSPVLAVVAKQLGVSVNAVREFAKGKPMTERYLSKVTKQLANGWYPGARTPGAKSHKRTRKTTRQATRRKLRGVVLGSVDVNGRERHRVGAVFNAANTSIVGDVVTYMELRRKLVASGVAVTELDAILDTLPVSD